MQYYKGETAAILALINRHETFMVTAHISADGDAYGAALATAYLLEKLGKKVEVIFSDVDIDEKYRSLAGWEDIISWSSDLNREFDAAIAVDVSSRKRIGDAAALLPEADRCVMIDHHPKEEQFADTIMHDTAASSASRLVFELVEAAGIEMDADLATLILTGIMFDTGRFAFSNTSSRDFEIAGKLIEAGARPEKVSELMMFNIPLISLKTIGYGLADLETRLNGKVGLIFLSKERIEVEEPLDIDPLASYSLSPRGAEVGIFIRETSELFKISLRSKGLIDVSAIAREIGGGGHKQAAGCRFEGEYNTLLERLLNLIEQQLQSVQRH